MQRVYPPFVACWGLSSVLHSWSTTFLGVVLVVVLATPAWADEELFILDNGSVLRGSVVREDDASMTIAMSGLIGETRVRVERSAIVLAVM